GRPGRGSEKPLIINNSGETGQERLVGWRQASGGTGSRYQVGALERRDFQAPVAPPALDLDMMPGEQFARRFQPLPLLGAGVMRAVQQAVERGIEAVELVAVLVAQHPRLQPGHGIEQRHRRDLAARENEVPKADLDVDMAVNE